MCHSNGCQLLADNFISFHLIRRWLARSLGVWPKRTTAPKEKADATRRPLHFVPDTVHPPLLSLSCLLCLFDAAAPMPSLAPKENRAETESKPKSESKSKSESQWRSAQWRREGETTTQFGIPNCKLQILDSLSLSLAHTIEQQTGWLASGPLVFSLSLSKCVSLSSLVFSLGVSLSFSLNIYYRLRITTDERNLQTISRSFV